MGDPTELPLAGRRALVTGASSDIGAAIVQALARFGARLVLHGHANANRLAALRDECLALGRETTTATADLTTEGGARHFAATALAAGDIDILINNAGSVLGRTQWLAMDAAYLDRVFNLNYRAPLILSQLLAPAMVERRRGVIINILSTAASLGGSETAIGYASAKGALQTLTRGLARVLAPDGVRVVAVAPGTIDTEFQRTQTSPELMARQAAAIPLGRIGAPTDIGEVVAFLATDAAAFIVGETIHVNGGLHMS